MFTQITIFYSKPTIELNLHNEIKIISFLRTKKIIDKWIMIWNEMEWDGTMWRFDDLTIFYFGISYSRQSRGIDNSSSFYRLFFLFFSFRLEVWSVKCISICIDTDTRFILLNLFMFFCFAIIINCGIWLAFAFQSVRTNRKWCILVNSNKICLLTKLFSDS